MPKRNAVGVSSDFRPGKKVAKTTTESYALRSRSTPTVADDLRSLAERERKVADAEREVAEMKRQVANAKHVLATRVQQVDDAEKEVADAKRALAIREHVLKEDETNLGKSAADACDAKMALPKSPADAGDAKKELPESAAGAREVRDKEKQKAIDEMTALWKAGGDVCPPEDTNDPNQITIKVKGPGDVITCFKINPGCSFRKLMRRYCEMQGLDMSRAKFFLREVHSTDRASALGLTDGTVLRVFEEKQVDQQ